MNECKRIEEGLASLMGGDSSTEERAKVMRHLAECDACADLFAIHAELDDMELPAAAESELLTMRREVLRSIRKSEDRETSTWWPSLAAQLKPWGALAMAAVALVLGILIGRWPSADRLFERAQREDTRLANSNEAIAGQLEFAALRNRRMEESANSPYTFSDLRVREIDEGRVELSFDVATHLELVRDKSDPLVSEILVQSLVNPAPVGTRLEAISLVRSREPKVRDALIVAMLEDESLPVRLGALEKLVDEPIDGETEAAFLQVLESEESVQMRLLAIDYLAKERVAPEMVESAILSGQPEPGSAIFVRAQDYFAKF
ncbi:MAG: anti-sigma factor family protein [Thermoanaerobaculia bacterium]